MNTTDLGRNAERIAAQWLSEKGHQVLANNWRTKWCEIDIVTRKQTIIYFVEVRYRKQATWGDGLDSITEKKRRQMEFAAQFWMHQNNWQGDGLLCVMAMEGDPVKVSNFIEL